MSGPASGDPGPAGNGWRDAVLFGWAIAALTVVYAYGAERGVHPVALLLIAMVIASLVMIASRGGPGPEALRIMGAWQSIAIGLMIFLLETSYYIALLYVSPAEGSLLTRVSIPIAMLAVWVLLARPPRPLALAGHVAILAALGVLLAGLEPQAAYGGGLGALATALFFVSRSFIVERHPWNRAARTVGERVRITGLVMLSAALVCWALTLGLVALAASGLLPAGPLLPRPAAFADRATLGCALLVGLLILPSMFYLSFSALARIGAESFTAVGAFIPAWTLVCQLGAVGLGLIGPRAVDRWLVGMMLVIVAATLLIVHDARRRQRG